MAIGILNNNIPILPIKKWLFPNKIRKIDSSKLIVAVFKNPILSASIPPRNLPMDIHIV